MAETFGTAYASLTDHRFVVKYRASCYCRAVRYEVCADPVDAKLCHCVACQKLHGAPMQWAAIFHKRDVRITRVTSPEYGSVEMHETVIEDGVARMSALGQVVLPAGSAVEFEPGGKHLMLMRPGDDLTVVELAFHSGEVLLLTVSVPMGE